MYNFLRNNKNNKKMQTSSLTKILTAQTIQYKYKNLFQASKALANAYKKWQIFKVWKGIYLAKNYTKQDLYIASNLLVANSYISTETILAEEGILTEIINPSYIIAVTTTRRPRTYNTEVWTFVFRYMKKELWFLNNSIDLRFSTFLRATKEKALIDYLYFKSFDYSLNQLNTDKQRIIFLESLRLDLSEIDWNLFNNYLKQINKIVWSQKWKLWLFKNLLLDLYKFRNKVSFY